MIGPRCFCDLLQNKDKALAVGRLGRSEVTRRFTAEHMRGALIQSYTMALAAAREDETDFINLCSWTAGPLDLYRGTAGSDTQNRQNLTEDCGGQKHDEEIDWQTHRYRKGAEQYL